MRVRVLPSAGPGSPVVNRAHVRDRSGNGQSQTEVRQRKKATTGPKNAHDAVNMRMLLTHAAAWRSSFLFHTPRAARLAAKSRKSRIIWPTRFSLYCTEAIIYFTFNVPHLSAVAGFHGNVQLFFAYTFWNLWNVRGWTFSWSRNIPWKGIQIVFYFYLFIIEAVAWSRLTPRNELLGIYPEPMPLTGKYWRLI